MDVQKSLITISISAAILGLSMGGAYAVPEEEDSVRAWGRWAVLSPAAGPEDLIAFAPAGGNEIGRCETAENCPGPGPGPGPGPEPEPEGICAAGTPCGLATMPLFGYPETEQPTEETDELLSVAQVDGETVGRKLVPFELDLDQSGEGATVGFRVNPGESDEVTSVPTDANVGVDGFRSTPWSGVPSQILGQNQVVDDGDVLAYRGFWGHEGMDGRYVWGITTSQADLDSLRIGDVSAFFSGNMMHSATNMEITVNFGPATWDGAWSGEHNFSAAGSVVGPNLVTGGFSNNVDPTSRLEGIIYGPAGNQAVGVGFEGAVDGVDYVDVGMARQVVPD